MTNGVTNPDTASLGLTAYLFWVSRARGPRIKTSRPPTNGVHPGRVFRRVKLTLDIFNAFQRFGYYTQLRNLPISTMPSLQESKLAFIGGGNMASAIIKGLVSQCANKQNIIVSEPWDVNREKIASAGVRTTTSNVEAGEGADLVFIAVKPQVTKSVCEELGTAWSKRTTLPIVVCIAAGVTLGSLEEWLKTSDGRTAHTVRVMPNTPALVNEGASGLFASKNVTAEEKSLVDSLLRSVSKTIEWVDEEHLLDVVTALSGGFLEANRERGLN